MPEPASRFKVPPRFTGVAFAFYMSAIVAFIMTVTLTALNVGIHQDMVATVLRGYAIAWPVGFASVLLTRPVVLKLMKWTVAPPNH